METTTASRPRSWNGEPILILYSLGLGLYISIYQAFVTFKMCLTTAKGSPIVPASESIHDFCMDLIGSARGSMDNATSDLRDLIEEKTTEFMIYYSLANNIPAIFMAFMVGAWSDAFGRKPPIIIALGGSTMGAFIVLAAATWDEAPLYLILISTFVNGFTGQVLVIYSGIFAMISDLIPDPVQLTVRIGLASALISVGFFVSSLVAGAILARWDDYAMMFSASLVFVAFSFLYTVFIAQETLQLVKTVPQPTDEDGTTPEGVSIQREASQVLDDASDVDVEMRDKKSCQCCRAFCSFGRIKESFNTLVKPRPGRHRLYLWVSIVGFLIAFSCDVGMPGILNLYVKRPPISLNDSQFSYLIACLTGSSALGMVALPWLAKRIMHSRDTFLIVLGLALAVGKSLTTAFATSAWMIFVAVSVGSLSYVYFTGYRAFLSKLVGRDESGRLFAVITSTEHIGPLISAFVFNNIYASTLHTFAGCAYLVAGISLGVVLLLMGWIHFDSGRRHDDVDAMAHARVEENGDQRQLIE